MTVDLDLAGAAGLICCYLAGFVLLTRKAAQTAGQDVDAFARPDSAQRWTALLFKLGFIGSGIWCLARALLPAMVPAWPIALDLLALPALGLAAIGACVTLGAQAQMAGSWRIGAIEGTLGSLVTGGFFAVSRNPVFVGQIVLFAGLALVRPDPVQAMLSLAVWVAAIWQVRIEEPVLRASLGEPYRAYAARTPRWLGFLKD